MNRLLHISGSFFLLALLGACFHSMNTQDNWLQLPAYIQSSNATAWRRWAHHCGDGSSVPRAAGATELTCHHERKWLKIQQAIFWDGRYFFWMCAVLYIPLWKSMQVYMRGRKPLGDTSEWFKTGLFLWNLILACLSIGSFVNLAQAILWHRTKNCESGSFGRAFAFCYQSDHCYGSGSIEIDEGPEGYAQKQRMLWFLIFGISKVPEMLDTVWLVLNKKEVLTLQWWHHLTVMLYTWLAGVSYPDSGDTVIFALVNSFIHSLMYPYFALAVMFKSVRSVYIRMTLTILQITQMLVGVGLRFYYDKYCTPIYPQHQDLVGKAGVLMYGSYLVLFIKFFVDEYYFKKGVLSAKKSQ